jgi:hypothetical protein
MAFVPGTKKYLSDSADHILDLANGLDFLNPKMDGIALLKKIGTNGKAAKSVKTEWTEVDLAPRGETMTLADGTATTLTVADAYIYQKNDLIRIENEVVRVTAIASATTLTIVRGYAGTTGAAHAAKFGMLLGSADPEGSDAPAGMTDTGRRLFNYVQTFTRGVSLSTDEIAQLSTEGNPLNGQIERRFIEVNRMLARAVIYGTRYEDTTNNIHTMGGLKSFVTTNVANVAGALTIAAIDAQILAIVNAGGDPDTLVMSPTVKQKLDALDNNKQMLGKKEHTGGGLVTQTWQSGILDHDLEIIVDHSILTDELWILDTTKVEIKPLENNGVSGAFHVEDSTTPGADREDRVIRGKYTMKVEQQKAFAYLYGIA